MVPADYENQLLRRFPDFSWENDLAYRIRKARIDYVPKYLSYILLFSPTFLSP